MYGSFSYGSTSYGGEVGRVEKFILFTESLFLSERDSHDFNRR